MAAPEMFKLFGWQLKKTTLKMHLTPKGCVINPFAMLEY
jgi:hypothetical protein